MSNEDLRVQRTHRLLRDAFLQLVVMHGYEQLTVRGIAQHAGVGYKTFYRHYDSKEALLTSVLDELIQAMGTNLRGVDEPGSPLANTIAALEFTRDNADLFLALAQSPAGDQLLEPMLTAAQQEGSKLLNNLDLPDELVIFHFASSLDSLLKWWLKNGMPYSVAEMASHINRLVIEPVQQLKKQSP